MGLMTSIYSSLGYVKLVRGDRQGAEKYLERAFELGMRKPAYLTAYGSMLMQKGEYERCKEVYNRALDNLGVNTMYYAAIVGSIITCDYKLGDKEKALAAAKDLYETVKNGTTYVIYGYLLMAEGRLDEALVINREGFEYDENDVAICDNLGQNYYFLEDRENAKIYFEKALDIKREMPDSCYFLAQIYLDEGNIERAYYLLDDAMDSAISALTTVTRRQIEERFQSVENIYNRIKAARGEDVE